MLVAAGSDTGLLLLAAVLQCDGLDKHLCVVPIWDTSQTHDKEKTDIQRGHHTRMRK